MGVETFRTIPWTDLGLLPRPTTLFGPFVQKPGTTALVGEAASGKSLLATAWAAHAATGTDWAGFEIPQTNVLVWPAEGLWTWHERLEAWQLRYDRIIPPDALTVITESIPLDSPTAAGQLGDLLHESEASLLIIDTVSRSKGGLSESDNDDMGKYLGLAEEAAQRTDAAVVPVHHSGWRDKSRERGASAFRGNVDQTLLIENDTQNSDRKKLKMLKNRGGPDDHTLELKLMTIQGAPLLVPDPAALSPNEEKIYTAMCALTEDGTWAQAGTIAAQAGVARQRISEMADSLCDKGLIEIQAQLQQGSPAQYRIKNRPE